MEGAGVGACVGVSGAEPSGVLALLQDRPAHQLSIQVVDQALECHQGQDAGELLFCVSFTILPPRDRSQSRRESRSTSRCRRMINIRSRNRSST